MPNSFHGFLMGKNHFDNACDTATNDRHDGHPTNPRNRLGPTPESTHIHIACNLISETVRSYCIPNWKPQLLRECVMSQLEPREQCYAYTRGGRFAYLSGKITNPTVDM